MAIVSHWFLEVLCPLCLNKYNYKIDVVISLRNVLMGAQNKAMLSPEPFFTKHHANYSCLALFKVNKITLQILTQLEVNKITSVIPFANQSIVHALYFPLFSNKKLKLDVIEWNR